VLPAAERIARGAAAERANSTLFVSANSLVVLMRR